MNLFIARQIHNIFNVKETVKNIGKSGAVNVHMLELMVLSDRFHIFSIF